jgi:hypothetical protein
MLRNIGIFFPFWSSSRALYPKTLKKNVECYTTSRFGFLWTHILRVSSKFLERALSKKTRTRKKPQMLRNVLDSCGPMLRNVFGFLWTHFYKPFIVFDRF